MYTKRVIMFSQLLNRRMASLLIGMAIALIPISLGAQIEKRVVFPKGKATITYKGKLPRYYADYDAYVLKAKKGQTITVKLTSAESTASFAIYETKIFGPDEDLIFPQNELNRTYTGKLPITSEYSIQVYGVTSAHSSRSSGAAYTIEISLR